MPRASEYNQKRGTLICKAANAKRTIRVTIEGVMEDNIPNEVSKFKRAYRVHETDEVTTSFAHVPYYRRR